MDDDDLSESNKVDDAVRLMDELGGDEDICRVCRLSGEGKLYHPCRCTGSIKYVHQDCLLQWLKYSKKEVCELCNHKFSFQPLYADDMPENLPLYEIAKGVFLIFTRFLRTLFTYCIVAVCWLFVVPVFACRMQRLIFSGLLNSLFSLKVLDIFMLDNLSSDVAQGVLIVNLFICTFIALVWLREQVTVGGPPHMLNLDPETAEAPAPEPVAVERAFNLAADGEELNVDANDEEQQPADVVEAPRNPNNENWGQDVERIVDDMTWQRLIGLDGSFVFVENVFWVISLNFIFSVTFLYWPWIIGDMFFQLTGLDEVINYFETPMAIFIGYIFIVQGLYLFHFVCRFFRWQPLFALIGTAYLMIKVFLLVILEVLIFPTICGWWLDICSLPLTGSSLDRRLKTFYSFPTSSVSLHWLAGMTYVFYSASFIMALRGLLRPGVLWFIRNMNDPEFNPIQEMIETPFSRHMRRLCSSTSLFLSMIFFLVYVPLQVIKVFLPGVIPYTLGTSDTHYSQFFLELLLFQAIIPSILEYLKAYAIMEFIVKKWCRVVGGWLSMESYLLSERDRDTPADERVAEIRAPVQLDENVNANARRREGNDLAARHQALLMVRESINFEHYVRPENFHARLIALIAMLWLTLILCSIMGFVVPVVLGRLVVVIGGMASQPIHEIYTVGIGLYACWLLGRFFVLSYDWIHRGWDYACNAFERGFNYARKIVMAAVPVVFVIPFVFGLYFQLLVVGPMRVSSGQSPIFFHTKEWLMGIVHLKIICATILMGPDWWLKTSLERVYEDGIRNFQLRMVYLDLALPTLNVMGLLISGPYVLARLLLIIMDGNAEMRTTVIRMSYPVVLCAVLAFLYLRWQWTKLQNVVRRIRNDKYLIGTQLVNFYREANTS